ncbi:MAG: hypothetical protein JWN20_1234 [Jatrophihabitantaceae bacterium]|nr:hypothetical protein [Jatrophihabitantaceae bacterium]
MDPGSRAVRIGVTGHRLLADLAAVRASVDAVLDRLLLSAAPAAAVPAMVISPLAEGADRLVARAVLDRPGGALEVLLPLRVSDYLTDFATPASRAEFRELLAAARSVAVVPGDEPSRAAAYERVGRAVVDGCDVLIALWDGEPGAGRGGTAEIVHYARANGVPVEIVAVRRGDS